MPSPDSSRVPCVVTIGNFDGVHLGHRHLLEQAKELARERALASVLVTSEGDSPAKSASQAALRKRGTPHPSFGPGI